MIKSGKKMIKQIVNIFHNLNVRRTTTSIGEGLRVNGKSLVNSKTSIANNVNLNGLCIKGQGRVVIGNNFHSGVECLLITEIHNYDYGETIPYDNTYICKTIIIEDNVWLGDRVIILGGVKLGEGSIIQAGSVVVNDIPKYGIAGGHPARVFKFRDIEHYEKLKKDKKFY